MDPAVSALMGAAVGAAAGLIGTALLLQHQAKTRLLDMKRDTYLAFIDALDAYHLAMLDYSAQARYFALGVASQLPAAVETLTATRSVTTSAYRRLGLFGDTDSQTIGEETLKLVIVFPEFDPATWANNPGQMQTDQQKIRTHADEVERQLQKFVRSSRADLGVD